MGRKVQFEANLKATNLFRNMNKHAGNLSEGDRPQLIATKTILGKKVKFYTSGEHVVEAELTPQEQYDSEILRFAHASLIVGEGVGDKAILYVDASVDPCDVWIYNEPAAQFIKKAMEAIKLGSLQTEFVVYANPIQEIRSLP